MTNEEAKMFLDNLKVCIDEHPVVADWLVEIANRKTENSSEIPNNCKPQTDMAEDIVRSYGFKAESYQQAKAKDEPQTCEDCKHNGEKHAYDYACDKCTDMDKFQHEDEPQTERRE